LSISQLEHAFVLAAETSVDGDELLLLPFNRRFSSARNPRGQPLMRRSQSRVLLLQPTAPFNERHVLLPQQRDQREEILTLIALNSAADRSTHPPTACHNVKPLPTAHLRRPTEESRAIASSIDRGFTSPS
jgi:hypothetical protein